MFRREGRRIVRKPLLQNLVVVLPQSSVEKEVGYGQEAEENEDVEEVTTPAGAL